MIIEDDDEFFVFMDLRLKYQWASFKMTSRQAVEAANAFNQEMKARNSTAGRLTVMKNPRAIVEKLTEMEEKIIRKIKTKNYTCESLSYLVLLARVLMFPSYTAKRSGTDLFWQKHCGAVPLVNEDGKKVCNIVTSVI